MAAAANETMGEGLKKLMSAIAQLMVLPDADLEFLTGLQGTITGFLRSQAEGTAQQAASLGQAGGAGGMGAPSPMGGMPGGGGMGMGMGGGMGGLMSSPNPDELRRLLGAGSAGG